MDSDFARQYYESASANHWWFRGRKQLVAGLLDRFGVDRGWFVDLGAGAESLFPPDLSIVKLDVVRPEGVKGRFVQASAECLPFPDASLDGVGLFDVLEHLDEPDRCLEEVRRVIRPGGHVLVTVPAYGWLWSPHDQLVGHKRRYTPPDLREILLRGGMEVMWLSAFYGFLLGPAVLRRVLSRQSPMKMPSEKMNDLLTSLALRSARKAMRTSTTRGLSLGAVAGVS